MPEQLQRKPQATIPEPYENLASLRAVALATKELVETLAGQRGGREGHAVTFGELPAASDTVRGDLTINGTLTVTGNIQGFYTLRPGSIYGIDMNGTPVSGSPTYYQQIIAQTNPAWGVCHLYAIHYPGVWAGHVFAHTDGSSYSFRNTNAYKAGGGVWADHCDARIKTVLGGYDRGLNEIKQLRPVYFTFKGNDTDSPPSSTSDANLEPAVEEEVLTAPYPNSAHYGAAVKGTQYVTVIAQEAEVPLPEMVTKSSGYIDGVKVDDLRELDTTPLIYALINAVKELAAKVETLEGRVGTHPV